jgi:hypothetical protein
MKPVTFGSWAAKQKSKASARTDGTGSYDPFEGLIVLIEPCDPKIGTGTCEHG